MSIANLRRTRWYRILLLVLLAASLILLWQLSVRVLSTSQAVNTEDHWRYWTAWHLAIRGDDPYDPINRLQFREEIPQLEKQRQGLPVILTPPWILLLITPFAPFAYPLSRMLWILASIILLMACARWIWQIYRGNNKLLWAAWLVTFIFFPTILTLRLGQINPWLLLGVIGFLYWTTSKPNDWLAGVSLALVAIKPQLFLVLWLAVLFWVIRERRWKIILAGGLALLLASLPFLITNPSIFQQFISTYLADTPVEWRTPTLGYLLRLLFGDHLFWLQFVAPLLGVIWIIFHWRRKRADWHWLQQMPVVLYASLLTSPYSWTYDQIVLLIPILAVTARLLANGWSKSARTWLVIYGLINLAVFILHRYFTDEYFIWLAPALLLWYWLANRAISKTQGMQVDQAT